MRVRGSFLARVLLLVLGLVAVLEVSSYTATRLVLRDAVTDNAREELLRGGEVFNQLMQSRAEQLALSVSVLTDDFGFREAVATSDAATIDSALINHTARVEADIGVVIDNDNRLVASTLELPPDRLDFLQGLQDSAAGNQRTAYASLVIGDRPYQFVMSPVRAPVSVGTAGIGFEIDDELTRELARLTGLEVSFLRLDESGTDYLSGTLPGTARARLLDTLDADSLEPGVVTQNETMMSLLVPVAARPVRLAAVLQIPLARVVEPFSLLDRQLLWLALVFSAVAAVLAVLLARGVTRPVRALADVAKRITAGNYDTHVTIPSGDELGELAQGFTRMQSAIAEREQQILYQASHDTLTRLVNRGQLFPELELAMQPIKGATPTFALLVVDIEHFTRINDSLSPEIGDRVLSEVAHRIESQTEEGDTAIRLGSDEFAVVLSGVNGQQAVDRAHGLLAAFDSAIRLEDLALNVDLNIGLVVYPEDGETPETLLRRANLALSHARAGRDRVCAYQHGWDEQHLRRLALSGAFREALRSDQITLAYQPKINLADRTNPGAEALVRWVHPQLGSVNPEEFIRVAESTGQVGLLTRRVLRVGIGQLAEWHAEGRRLQLSVNLSALDLLEDDLPGYIGGLLSAQRLAPHHLCLEITESAIMGEAEKSLRNLDRLSALGVLLSIDDFGTGYSSLSQLKKLPVSELKIDKSFIFNLVENEDDRLIVRSIIDLGRTMGLSITAEGVETTEIEALLLQAGCDTVQGFLYSKALPSGEFRQWLDDYHAAGCTAPGP